MSNIKQFCARCQANYLEVVGRYDIVNQRFGSISVRLFIKQNPVSLASPEINPKGLTGLFGPNLQVSRKPQHSISSNGGC